MPKNNIFVSFFISTLVLMCFDLKTIFAFLLQFITQLCILFLLFTAFLCAFDALGSAKIAEQTCSGVCARKCDSGVCARPLLSQLGTQSFPATSIFSCQWRIGSRPKSRPTPRKFFRLANSKVIGWCNTPFATVGTGMGQTIEDPATVAKILRVKRKRNGAVERGGRTPCTKPQPRFTTTVCSIVDLPPQNNMPAASTSMETPEATSANPATISFPRIIAMPRPGQPGAVQFNNSNVSEFLDEWERFCLDYGLSERDRIERLPSYCTDPNTKDSVKFFPGFATYDWKTFRSELRKFFKPYDKREDTLMALRKLVKMDPKPDLRLYVLKFTSISSKLVAKSILSPVARVSHFIDGLDVDLRRKALQFCLENKWRLSDDDDDDLEDPNYDRLSEFVLAKADLSRLESVFDSDRALRDGQIVDDPIASIPSTATSPKSTPPVPALAKPPAPMISANDPMAELSKQFSQLVLMLQSSQAQPTMQAASAPAPAVTKPSRPYHCMYCDSTDHFRKGECSALQAAIGDGKVRLDEYNRIVNARNGEKYPLRYGQGGIRSLVENTNVAASTAITLEPCVASVGGQNSVHYVTIDENGNILHEAVDVDVDEKRKWSDDGPVKRHVRPRVEEPQSSNIPMENPPATVASPSKVLPDEPAVVPTPIPPSTTVPVPKYRLASSLQDQVSFDTVGEKLMDTPVSLTMKEVCAISPDLGNWLSDRTRKRRKPIEATFTSNTTATPILYAAASGKVKATLDGTYKLDSLLDDGSEVNLMSLHAFQQMNLPIDTEIDWKINGYDGEPANMKDKGVIGVCHNVKVDIGGVEIPTHIFVVAKSKNDLLLGRPWAKAARAQLTNEDNGTYTVRIKSLDGRRVVKFIAVKAGHERDRIYARNPGEEEDLKA